MFQYFLFNKEIIPLEEDIEERLSIEEEISLLCRSCAKIVGQTGGARLCPTFFLLLVRESQEPRKKYPGQA